MTRNHLYEFVVLTHTLSFSDAAKRLYISQATLSRHISELEKKLGTTLFYRNTHNVSLTAAGELFHQDARALLRKYDESQLRLRYQTSSIHGHCCVLFSNCALTQQLMDILESFRLKYQEISLKIDVMPEYSCTNIMGDYDIILSTFPHGPECNDDYEPHIFSSYGACLVIPLAESFHHPHLAHLIELAGKNIFLPYTEYPSSPFREIWEKTDAITHHRAKLITTPNIETALLNVNIGCGVTILPRYFDERLYHNSRIVYIPDDDFKFDVYAYLNQNSNSDAARLLYTELITQAALL